jgi:hypothetical protein
MQRTDASALSIYYGAGNIIFLTQLLASKHYEGAWRVTARREGLRPTKAACAAFSREPLAHSPDPGMCLLDFFPRLCYILNSSQAEMSFSAPKDPG